MTTGVYIGVWGDGGGGGSPGPTVEQLTYLLTQQAAQLSALAQNVQSIGAGQADQSNVKLISGPSFTGMQITGDVLESPPQNRLLGASDAPVQKGTLVMVTFDRQFTFTTFTASGSAYLSAPSTFVFGDELPGLTGVEISSVEPVIETQCSHLVAVNCADISDTTIALVAKADALPAGDSLTCRVTFRLVTKLAEQGADPGADDRIMASGAWNSAGFWRNDQPFIDGV
jgi:hypothetical protein